MFDSQQIPRTRACLLPICRMARLFAWSMCHASAFALPSSTVGAKNKIVTTSETSKKKRIASGMESGGGHDDHRHVHHAHNGKCDGILDWKPNQQPAFPFVLCRVRCCVSPGNGGRAHAALLSHRQRPPKWRVPHCPQWWARQGQARLLPRTTGQ